MAVQLLDKDALEATWKVWLSQRGVDVLGYPSALGYAPMPDPVLEARCALQLQYTSMVRATASKVGASMPNMVDREDLAAYGQFGLMEALDNYDAGRGVKFETFAIPRIRGSIIDELRKIDPVPRTVRARVRELEKVRAELQTEFGREPVDQELALALGLSMEKFWDLKHEAHTSTYSSLDENEEAHTSVAETAEAIGADPEDIFGAGEITELVATAISGMPERYKTILVLYYLHEMTLAEIGEVLGVTESRVCQLQSKVLGSLRESLNFGALTAA